MTGVLVMGLWFFCFFFSGVFGDRFVGHEFGHGFFYQQTTKKPKKPL